MVPEKKIQRPVEQNRGPDMSPHSYAYLLFNKVAKNILWKKASLFKNVAGKSGYLPAEN
jgi:hypothetical protein